MFLDVLSRRNKKLIEAAVELHQKGLIPANSYLLDVDAIKSNAELFSAEGKKHNLKVFAMTKQIGRNPVALQAISEAGIDACVAVDMACARPIHASGLKVGHLGHLVQVPRAETRSALNMEPEYWTIFSHEKAKVISEANNTVRVQKLLTRVFADGDIFYKGHEGGFPAKDILKVVEELDHLKGVAFSGITTFPAQLFDQEQKDVLLTHNMKTLMETLALLFGAGVRNIEINAPGTTSCCLLERLASAGATQVEPGHGLTGTTPLHAVKDLAEQPAMVYVSEVSHIYGGKPYCFGGGMYIDPVFPDYPVKAYVGSTPDAAWKQKMVCDMPNAASIDYYGILQPEREQNMKEGDTVIFGFRAQTFVTRAYMVPVSGISKGKPIVHGCWTTDGRKTGWPEW